MVSVAVALCQMAAGLDGATRTKLGYGPSEEPKPPETPDAEEPEVIAHDNPGEAVIRAFRNDPKLRIQFVATAPNPYSSAPADIDIYEDEHDFEYWLDSAAGRLIQAGPRAGLHPEALRAGSDGRLPVAELRERAVALAGAQVRAFAERRSTFHPYEDNRRGQVYFFRWESCVTTDEFSLPPFVQVGLYADGTLACFTNTLEE
jgi:hypothetical protein